MRKTARKIAVMIGSDSDLPQCELGLRYLKNLVTEGKVEVMEVITSSIHRNPDAVKFNLRSLSHRTDVLIVGAGWANHLTGMVDALLRYKLHNDHIVVVGVAFADEKNPIHTQAACLSITEVPGTQVVFDGYVGEAGFLRACERAGEGDLPKITLPATKPVQYRTLEEALTAAIEAKSKKS